MTHYRNKPIGKRLYRPTYSQVVRNGLSMIAARTTATSDEERRALQWIVEMHTWPTRVIQPYAHAEHKRRKKRPEGATA